ncbi:MAG: class I SAM-dependent methyltransferase [Actinomycetota bacterium]|nr:class I SAM-dependent methyltransferase [Actinomycetota bacterium]
MAWQRAEQIAGWFTEAQARSLWQAAKRVLPPHVIVEIGSHEGRSTTILAAAAGDGVQIYAVDPFDDPTWGGGTEAWHHFHNNLRSAIDRDQVHPLRRLSHDAGREWERGAVGLLLIDGAHDYPTVLGDIDLWTPFVPVGGTVLIHDAYSSLGVTRAVLRRFLRNGEFLYRGSAGSLAHFDRVVSRGPRLAQTARMVGRLGWFSRNIVIKVALRQGWDWALPVLGHQGREMPI